MPRQLGDDYAKLGIEGFHLPDNLMIVGAVHSGGYPIFVPTDDKARGIDGAGCVRGLCGGGGAVCSGANRAPVKRATPVMG